jgi:raffinose/stachyose/melibiose transport system substrate-binding protein
MDKVKSEDDLGAFVMPWRSSESEPLTSMTLSDMHVGISKNSENLEEAKAFLQWIFSQGFMELILILVNKCLP